MKIILSDTYVVVDMLIKYQQLFILTGFKNFFKNMHNKTLNLKFLVKIF